MNIILKYFNFTLFVLFVLIIQTSCEIENKPIEILSLESSDSVIISGDTVKLYVEAFDFDDDKISYSWDASEGTFLAQKDTAYWIAPNQSGYFNITCKVSDGIGSSDAKAVVIRVVGKIIKGQVLNAVNGTPITGAEVRIENTYGLTDMEGNYVLFMAYDPGDYFTFSASVDLFCPYAGSFLIPGDYYDNKYTYNLSMSPIPLEGEIRLVLNWGAEPRDLDSHIKTPAIDGTEHHILYSNKGSSDSAPFVKLDIDDTSGYGPETFTITQLFEGKYAYYIYQFSSDATLSTSNATVNIYNSPDCEGVTIIVPDSGVGRYWYVCNIDGTTGDIDIINIIQATEPN